MPGNKLAIFPDDIHKMIYDHLNYAETLFLSITCRHFFILAQPHLYQLATELLQIEQSAGDRFVCVGDYTYNIPVTLLPRGASRTHIHECKHNCVRKDLDPKESVAIREATETSPEIIRFPLYVYVANHFPSKGSSWHNPWHDQFSRKLQKVYNREVMLIFEEPRLKEFHQKSNLDSGPDIFRRRPKPAHPAAKEAERWMLSELFSQMQDQYPRLPASRCILRNLTTQEYVIDNGKGFNQVLYSQICYSNDPSISMHPIDFEGEELYQGPWAGHRFDITSLDDIEEDRKAGKEWKDDTLRIRKKLKVIYDVEFGEGEYSVDQPDDSEPSAMLLKDPYAPMCIRMFRS
jgi:hypothetical protein